MQKKKIQKQGRKSIQKENKQQQQVQEEHKVDNLEEQQSQNRNDIQNIFQNENLLNVNIFKQDQDLNKINIFEQSKEDQDEYDFEEHYNHQERKEDRKQDDNVEDVLFLQKEKSISEEEQDIEDEQNRNTENHKEIKYEINTGQGPQQFLKVIGKDKNGSNIYKLSDLFYPNYETEYENLEKYIQKKAKNMENNMEPQKKEEQQQQYIKIQQQNLQYYNNLQILREDIKLQGNKEILENLEQLYNNDDEKTEHVEEKKSDPQIHQIYNKVYKKFKSNSMNNNYNVLNSYEFYKDLKKQILVKNRVDESFSNEIQKIEEMKEKKEMVNSNLNNGQKEIEVVDQVSQKDSVYSGRISSDANQINDFDDLNDYFNQEISQKDDEVQIQKKQSYQVYEEEEKVEENNQVQYINKEQNFLQSINNEIQQHWGELKDRQQEQFKLDSNQLIETRDNENNYNENQDTINLNREINIKDYLFLKSQYYNKDLIEIRRFLKIKRQEIEPVLIDINNPYVYYDKVHGKYYREIIEKQNELRRMKEYRRKLLLQDEQQNIPNSTVIDYDLTKENATNMDQEGNTQMSYYKYNMNQNINSDEESVSMASAAKQINVSQNLLKKTQKMKLKELRVQAVQQGLDPSQVTITDENLIKKKMEMKKAKESSNISLLNLIQNFKQSQRRTRIQHSRVSEKFQYNSFKIKNSEALMLHRYDFNRYLLFNRDGVKMQNQSYKVKVINQEDDLNNIQSNEGGQQNSLKRKNEVSLDDLAELVDSFEAFKTRKRLSLQKGSFSLFEYIEESPLLLGNVGMSSKLVKYIYSDRVIAYRKQKYANKNPKKHNYTTEEEIQMFKDIVKQKFGNQGMLYFLENEKLPLLGQLTDTQNIGILVLENNLFKAPVFIQKPRKTDFVLVRYREENGQSKFYLRKPKNIYLVGQIEPKMEVFAPNSRALSAFLRKCVKYQIKNSFQLQKKIDLRELNRNFPQMNDHNLRKHIKELGGEQDINDNKMFHYQGNCLDSDREDGKHLEDIELTPEEICLFEKMHESLARLKQFGIQELRSGEKINLARIKFGQKNQTDYKSQVIARLISQEVQLTSWNLSQSFLAAQQTQGRMYLTGFGDPTNGHGGMSYVKLPLKTSRYEKDEKEQKKSMVTGTNADLRKLPMSYVIKILKEYKYQEENLKQLQRWEKIALLRQISNNNNLNLHKEKESQSEDEDDEEEPVQQDLSKFARTMRVTTKIQRERYQKNINKLLQLQIQNLSQQDIKKVEIESKQIQPMSDQQYFLNLMAQEQKEIQEYLEKKAQEEKNQKELQQQLQQHNKNEDKSYKRVISLFNDTK